jgi:hypothetical protein
MGAAATLAASSMGHHDRSTSDLGNLSAGSEMGYANSAFEPGMIFLTLSNGK